MATLPESVDYTDKDFDAREVASFGNRGCVVASDHQMLLDFLAWGWSRTEPGR